MNPETTDGIHLNIEEICRTCLNEGELQSLYENFSYIDEELTIADMLIECAIIQVKYI